MGLKDGRGLGKKKHVWEMAFQAEGMISKRHKNGNLFCREAPLGTNTGKSSPKLVRLGPGSIAIQGFQT